MTLIPMLAQLPDPKSAESIGWVLIVIVAIIAGINQAMRLFRSFKESPPPHQTYATKEQHRELELKLDAELGRERSARKRIHEEIAALQANVAAIKVATDSQATDTAELKERVAEINSRIDTMPQRIVSLLRETQQLHQAK